jgi:WD40 repeat protein
MCYSSNQIATLCSESFIKVWEADTGRYLYTLREPNGIGVDTICMCVDPTGYKLVTGGANGSIKIWNFGTGHEMKNKQKTIKKCNDNEFKMIDMKFLKIKSDLFLYVYDSVKIKVFQVIKRPML